MLCPANGCIAVIPEPATIAGRFLRRVFKRKMPKKPLLIAFLWHMHQPDYRDAQTGEIYLPWTRFHAIKDYLDMGKLAADVPGCRLTINVVPSLLDQLIAYGDGTARETCAGVSLKNAAHLDTREKAFLLRTFFQLSWKHMIFPNPRYRELLDRRGGADAAGEYPVGMRQYSTQDFRDLQTWFNLAWSGNELRRDPAIAALFRKGRAFTEDDKRKLLEVQMSFVGKVLPFYRGLMETHGMEISTSPYYHPILPLLCDSRSAREALPTISLPRETFSYTADAREHIERARQRFSELFGRPAQGMWPSEGSVSNAAMELAREAGLRWLASDEGVLLQSLQKLGRAGASLSLGQRYSAWRWGDREDGPCLFFRDHELSDLIGFTYANWKVEDAAADFTQRLHNIHRHLPNDGRMYVVPIILDGENAWEHYPENGAPFLQLLYKNLANSADLKMVTFSEFLDLETHREPLPSLLAGSWIYGSFATWIGHPEKNRAWEFLIAARRILASCQSRGMDKGTLERARLEMMIAEGSDWFWWYGDDHQTDNAAEFDALFRGHVKNVYRVLGEKAPAEFDIPIKAVGTRTQYRNPVHTITPKIDGKVTSYYEWLSAGFATPGAGESMHRSQRFLEKLYFGYDSRNFYLRLDLEPLRRRNFPATASVQVSFSSPAELVLMMAMDSARNWQCVILKSPVAGVTPAFAGDKILELAIPLGMVGIENPAETHFAVSVWDGGHEAERFPSNGTLAVPIDPWGLDQREWFV
jgi:alpha-amylase/alpha-mannosidase (GH57 family)